MLIGLAAAAVPHGLTPEAAEHTSASVNAVLFYLVAYGAMTVGAFAVIASLNRPEQPVENVDDLAGLSRSHPSLALVMVLFLFSLIGIPLTAGFVGKLQLFLGAMAVQNTAEAAGVDQARLFRILALIGAINAAIGAWYYLRIAAVMYLREPARRLGAVRSGPLLAAVLVCAAVTLLFGVYPEPLARKTREALPRPSASANVTAMTP